MINISPRPLPSWLRAHANAHIQTEIHLLFPCTCTHSLLMTHTPTVPSQPASGAGWLGLLFELVPLTQCRHSKGTSITPHPMMPTRPSLLPLPHHCLRLSPCASSADQVKRVDHLISGDFVGSFEDFLSVIREKGCRNAT